MGHFMLAILLSLNIPEVRQDAVCYVKSNLAVVDDASAAATLRFLVFAAFLPADLRFRVRGAFFAAELRFVAMWMPLVT
jgi:hypothetical protein